MIYEKIKRIKTKIKKVIWKITTRAFCKRYYETHTLIRTVRQCRDVRNCTFGKCPKLNEEIDQ